MHFTSKVKPYGPAAAVVENIATGAGGLDSTLGLVKSDAVLPTIGQNFRVSDATDGWQLLKRACYGISALFRDGKMKKQIKPSLYSLYYAKARNQWRGPSPRLSVCTVHNTAPKKHRSSGEPLATLSPI